MVSVIIPTYAHCNWQSYPVRVLKNSPVSRNKLMQYLLNNGIATRPGIMNAHTEKVYSNLKFKLPESEKARRDVIIFPVYQSLQENDIKRIAELIKKKERLN
jgi:dTDP-4-amino-4,6-dideoxygalactose transaminase